MAAPFTFRFKAIVHKRNDCIEVNISVTLLRHTHGMERECWCINVTTTAKELMQNLNRLALTCSFLKIIFVGK
jgi:hypothetical protein